MRKMFLIIGILVLGNLNIAKAVSITQTKHWEALNVDVNVTYPDKVFYGDSFGISFFIDSTPLSPFDMMAFIPNIRVSNTVNISNVTWGENVVSPGDPDYDYNFAGKLGDTYSQYTEENGIYTIRLLDANRYPSGYTWLDRAYQDNVTWSLNNFIIQGDTDFNIYLDTKVWNEDCFNFAFTVLDPPFTGPGGLTGPTTGTQQINNAVPEPATLTLLSSLACGIFCFRKKKPL